MILEIVKLRPRATINAIPPKKDSIKDSRVRMVIAFFSLFLEL